MNFRGNGGAEVLTPKLYCADSYEDIEETIDFILNKYKNRKLFAMALSLGGNVLVHMMGRQGSNCKLSAVVILQSPLMVYDADQRIKHSFFGLYN
jgi:predicted alpha/beta-fold hydrolase